MARSGLYKIVWWLLTALFVGLFLFALPPRHQELSTSCNAPHHHRDCGFYVLTQSQAETLADWGISINLYAAMALIFDVLPALIYLSLGIFLMLRRPDDRVTQMMSLSIIAIGIVLLPEVIPALERKYPALDGLVAVVFSLAALGFVHLLATFPSGRYEPRWVRWNAATLYLAVTGLIIIDIFFHEFETSPLLHGLSDILVPLLLIGTLIGQIYRYRHIYSRTQQQQVKWVLFGLGSVIFARLTWRLLFDESLISSESTRLWFYLSVLPLHALIIPIFPITVAIAILRYRLYDIDVIVNRTLVYIALSAALGFTYIGMIIAGEILFRFITGETTQIDVAISTLVVAGLFRPAKSRIQSFVDLHFYRKKYDAQQTLRRFASSARNAVDLDELAGDLTQVVSATVQPEHISVWMRPEPDRNNRE